MHVKKRTLFVVQAAVIAALYAALTLAQSFLLPGTTSLAIQFRISEVLCVLALFTPAAIPGLTAGCFIANIFNTGTLPLDILLGPLASFLAAAAIYLIRNTMTFKIPLAPLVMPALFNGFIIGFELVIYDIPDAFGNISYLGNGLCVAIGELGVCLILGIPLYFYLKKANKARGLFSNEPAG